MYVPPFLAKKTKRCERCDLRYPASEARCTHCGELSDDELAQLRMREDSQRAAYGRLGVIMLVLALVVALWLGIGWLIDP